MKPKFFDEWMDVVQTYCKENGLDFEKAKALAKCGNQDFFALQYHDPEKGTQGLMDETPAPLVLIVSRGPDGLRFEQTEHTQKYLAG